MNKEKQNLCGTAHFVTGTALARLRAVHERVRSLTRTDLSGRWQDVRRKLLWAGGLRDLENVTPGQGTTINYEVHIYDHVRMHVALPFSCIPEIENTPYAQGILATLSTTITTVTLQQCSVLFKMNPIQMGNCNRYQGKICK